MRGGQRMNQAPDSIVLNNLCLEYDITFQRGPQMNLGVEITSPRFEDGIRAVCCSTRRMTTPAHPILSVIVSFIVVGWLAYQSKNHWMVVGSFSGVKIIRRTN